VPATMRMTVNVHVLNILLTSAQGRDLRLVRRGQI
jgi:hypothetical protein